MEFKLYTGCPVKVSDFSSEVTLEIWRQKAQFRCLWNAEMYSYFFIQQILKFKIDCQDGGH